MIWLVLTILAIFARGTMGLATKLFTNQVQVSALTQTTIFMAIAAVLTLIMSPFIGGITLNGVFQNMLPIIGLIGAQCFGNILFFKGQKALDVSVTQIASSSIIIWSTLFAVTILHGHFSITQCAGILLLIIAIIFVQQVKKGKRLDWPVLYILGAAVFYALFQVVSAEVSKSLPASMYLLFTYFGTAVVLVIIQSKKILPEIKSLTPKLSTVIPVSLFVSASSVAYFVLFYEAYQRTDRKEVIIILLPAQVIISVLLGIVILRERQGIPRKIVAAVVAVIAGGLIKS